MSETITQSQTEQLNDRQKQLDVLDQLLKPEVQESLNTLVEQLPKLTEIVNILTKSYDFAQSVATDDVLKKDTVSAISEIAGPVVDSVKGLAATSIEAKDRAEVNNDVIGLFGLLRMMKDPQAQKLFRFAQAFLEVSSERKNQK
ncbi:DUF1641 domain-containing protein [Peribacillus sp. RS7]|uniref:DUF1641 domain-containing protein n=1 Tax=unclassified Peribacillus TaxID=2675266 RepID=UPI0025A0DF46|nr:DUF1641 domain-containing protein [Peribacillus sp. ACCC06369]MDM5360603.1 DUF1641 domain-containing protein [Peribacillus sp. ACCC06369]